MRRRTWCRSLRGVLFFIVLFFLLLVPLLFPAFGSPDSQYDFVDDNTSNVDGFSDIGIHSNFTAQQYGPDSIYDTLTEENTGGGATWSNNTQPSALILETDPDISGSARTYETYGLNNLASDDSTYGGGDIQNCGTVNDPQEVSLIMEFDYSGLGLSGSDISYLRFEAEVYFIGGPGRKPANDPWEMETTFYNGSVDVYNWGSGSWEIMGTVFIDHPADLSIWDNIGDVNPERPLIRFKDSSFSDAYMNASGYIRIRIQMTGVFQGTPYDGCSVIDYVDVDLQYGVENYELDLEVQWTNARYNQTYKELCIYGGTMGSENIRVDVWSGSTWHNLFTDLSSGWNNVSVTDYLVSSTFTLRFKGGVETGDTSQDSWEIDCTLLHTWGIPPVANFFYTPEYPYTGETVTFNASDSYDPDGSIVSYSWDFGDGTNGTGEITTHSYTDSGTYSVFLTVTDNDGASDTTSKDVTVLNRPPIAIFTESATTVLTGEVIYFDASDSYDPDGSIMSYFWDFGDGTNASGVVVEHAYADDGNYTVTLTVTDDDGATDSSTAAKTVLNRSPVALFTESAEIVYTNDTIYFNASDSYDPDGSIVSYWWDFGDGSNSTGVTTEHLYLQDGNYTVTLTVTDDDGATNSTSASKMVLNRPPVALFTESAETVYTNETIHFNATESYDPDGLIVSYFWDFGDGTNATGVTVDHLYTENGNYSVTLTVTDDDGATDTTSATKTVLNRPPVASFTESAETVYTGETIHFNASQSYDQDGSIVSYFWDFGDGSNASGVTVDHAYADDGNHTVTLTVTDDDGATDTVTAIKTVLNMPPVASFSESATTVLTGEVIYFNASSSNDSDGTIVSYFWDFGDGANATGVLVEHAYADDGNYTVTLTVTDDDGATDTATSTKAVLNRPPVASFTESAETVYTGEVIYFNASASHDPDGTIVSYFWDFGDGTNTTSITAEHSYSLKGNYTVALTVTDDDGATSSTSAVKTVLNRPPVALFTESAETVYTGETITFNASDSYDLDGYIVIYFWDFGDGTNATGVVVEHSYVDDGIYTVTLTVTDDDGATASTTATKTILNRPPVASFTESAETVLTSEVITFNASGSYDQDGYIASYFWDFGDGTNATGVVVEHAYADDGIYTVTLTVTDDDGAIASAIATKTVLNRPPVASFTESATTVFTDGVIYFNASASYDPDGSIVSYFWDFGDATNATGVVVSHAYADDGNYTVTLTITDDDGATDTATSTKTVLNRPPVALFTESAETVLVGEIIYFNASDSYDPDGYIVSYFWDFGDGTNATGVTTEHAYADNGVYTVTLTITDDDEATASTTATKNVEVTPPVAIFTESAETTYTGEVIYFNASDSYDPDGTIVSYEWDFGDGTNGTGVTVEHAYTDDGNYTVTLTVTDDDGAPDTATSTKTILNRPPVALFTETAETVYTGETITFNASDSYDADGYIVSYLWNFGDGTNATGVVVEHAYADDGNYTVTLTVTDDDGATDTATSTKTVLNRPPVASFSESAETVLTGEVIYFNASASYDTDGSIVSYFWDFGDGANATGIIVEHAYADDGVFNVTLTVTDDDGAAASAPATKTVLNRPPVPSFTESATTVLTGEVIHFNASASYDPDGSIVSYFWDFGDGTNTTGVNVQHSYVDDGNYTVTLTVTDDDGATSSTSAVKMVLNRPPVALFTESAETVYTGETITFNASGSYDPDGSIVSYFWDFGDATNTTGVVVNHAYADDGAYTVTLTVTDNDGATGAATSTKTVLNRPPIASFTESAETVLTGEPIYFNASASYDLDGSIVSYSWDFGDGTNTTGVNVNHAYVDDGNYTVTLTVTDDDGATDTATSTKTAMNRPPVAIFTESAETVYTGNIITFNASESYDPDGALVSYFWDFGEGTNATGVVVEHSYVDDGNYTVTLTATDDDDAVDTATSIKTVLNRPPIASFTESAETVLTGETITFNASASYDPDGYIVSYFWNFGDGTNATGVVVEHTYADDGDYTVTLTVRDDDAATATTSATKTVLNRPPVALFTESAEIVYTNEVIAFNASDSYDPDGVIVGYFWDFGDGSNGTGVTVDHFYVDDGNYTVTSTVTDNDGATASTSSTKTVLNRPAVAIFTESAETVETGVVITFNASASYDPDGVIASYFWNFGDGTNSTGTIVDHAYADDGNYTVTLTVTDDDGAIDSATSIKYILNRPPVALFAESAETVYTGEVIAFNATDSYDSDGTIVSYFWDFGDGTNSTGIIVNHAYLEDGNYTVALTVTDDDGATASTSATKTVLNRPPVAVFTESAEIVYTSEVITFNASESYDPDGAITSYFWDFGDATNATGLTTEHAYADDGNYTVTLTITDNDGASASASFTKKVLNRPPVASFTESTETAYTGETITFDASASHDPDGSIVSYFWDFGDGTNGTGVTLGHSYADDGNYTVTLTVTDNDDATGTATATKTILNRSPVASFTESATVVYTGTVIYFDASDSYDPDGTIASYFWDFGDGTNATGVTVEHAYADDGSYVVTLTVADDDGATGVATATKKVLNRPPVASFTESAEIVYTSQVISFNASASYDPDGVIVSYFWDYGDNANATGMIVDHAYSEDGNYTVTLMVPDDDGAIASSSATKTVLNRPPIASFTESAETVVVGETIYFNASASYDPDGSIIGYFWDFGDGTNATGVTTEHAYADNGVYTVTLTTTDDDGATASATATKNVEVTPPVAIFTESAESVLTGEVIYFNASGSYDPDGLIVSYFWDFGDGTNATGVTAENAYVDDGNYTVTLTVTDDDDATDTATSTKTILNRSPAASFTESATTVYIGEIIYFDASSSNDSDGTIVSYFWDFGDATNATGMTVEHAYSDDGNYTVTLTVTDDDGATASTTAIKAVLNRPPVALFAESAETVYTGETITFNASDSYDPDGTIVGYFWDFGDGSNTTSVIAGHSYSEDGNYTVTLTVTDDDGASSSLSATKTVLNRPPVASFTESAESVIVGEVIYFNASASYDPDGVIISFFWDFGDGTNATGVTVEHAYADNGVYTVTLTLTDDDGATASASATKTVEITPPVAIFTETAETVYTGENIAFNASDSYDPDGFIVSYFWDFGDGTNATGVIVGHAYVDDGNYTVTLTVTDDDGATDTATSTKSVLNRSPVAIFTESAESVLTGEVIYFNASGSYDPDGIVASYFWDFGDGANASGVLVDHSYADDGDYTVALTVTDDDGATDTASSIKTVLNRPPVASFTESAETVYTGEAISFNASSSYDPDGTIASYFWDFGDGTNATGVVVVGHSYADNGTYTVALTVTDDDGATASTNATKTILNRPPVATFTESAEIVYTGDTIAFNASESYDPDGTIASYFWDFGDGTNGTGVTVGHSYADNGTYTVTLTVTDDDGVTDTFTSTKTVLNRSPVASFTESAAMVYTNAVIYFNASDSDDPDGVIVSYLWDFGDGTNATGITIEHAYSDDGNYTVTLTVTDDDGATASASATKTILNRSPVALFTESAETVLTGEVIHFNASDSYDPDGYIVSYFWDFGDGTNATGVTTEHAYANDGVYNVTLTITDDDSATASTTATKTVGNSPPVAIFTESAETVYTGEVITFNASSSYDPDGSVVSYFWDFGDGTNAPGVTVDHSYVDDGNYTVTLTVTDDDGATSTSSATKTVLNRSPVASFTESATTVYTGEIIYFDASSSNDSDGTIVSYFWDFGDGSNATGVIIDHAYTDDGNYTVTLTVTDDDGASASSYAAKTVLNRSPVASFIYSPDHPDVNETVTFNASTSYDPDGYIINYTWDFGDGNITTVDTSTITHVYTTEGDYTVTLTVTDDDGATGIATDTVTVGEWPPVAAFTWSPESPIADETVTFNASDSYDPDGNIVSYVWDFGDDNITTVTKPILTHVYSAAGNYTVILTVTDDDGLTDTAIDTMTVREIAPVAVFTYSPDFPIVNETVTFNASDSYDSNGYITSYSWDFGDGNTTAVTDPTITHVYSAFGNYTVSLTVTDNDGLTDTTTDIVRVRDYPTASFAYSPTSPYMGDTITFDASSSVANGGVITSYLWDFGDGSPFVNETDPTTTHVYDAAGNYTVTLAVTDSEGLSDSTTEIVTVGQAPVAVFAHSPDFPIVNETVTFNASDSHDPNGYIVSYVWKFGDGNITTVSTPIITHVYTEQGRYKVVLTVVDNDGYTDTSTVTIGVRDYPTASFTYSPDSPIADEIVTFNASSSTPNGGEITTYSWDFGDGTNATVTDPITTHVYLAFGNYTVTLTVTDSEELSDSESKTLNVRQYPKAAFTYTPTAPVTGETVTFNASSSVPDGGVITSYLWDFGDGSPQVNETDPVTTHIYTAVGNYTVTLTVADSEGLTDTTSDYVMVGKPPVATFTYSPDYPLVGETVTFNASESYDPDGDITDYSWDFGDGNTTTVTNPIITHDYITEGNYTVILTVTDNEGLTDTAAQTVGVRNYPTAVFTYSPDYPIVGEAVTFNATSSSPNGGSITSYQWNFGDGNVTIVTKPIIIHIYSAGGNYTVTLTVTDSEGLSDSSSKLVAVKQYPVASFTYSPDAPYVGDVVTFNASESYDPNGYILSYLWDFGDGSPQVNETNPVTTHIYAVSGNYTVTLTVTDNEGLNDTVTLIGNVRKAPTAVFTYAPDSPIVNETVTFNASDSYDPNGYIANYTWDFGDGNVTTVTTPITSHAYSAEGNYTVTLTVTDNDGYADTTSDVVTVRNYPTAAFTYSPDYPIAGETVSFDAASSSPNGGVITSYSWDFGDGTNSTSVIVDHVYPAVGNYTVTLTVTDSEGLSDSESKSVRVRQYPTAVFTYWPSVPYVGDTLTLNASSSLPHGGLITSYFWDFGDGNTKTVTTPIVTHVYSAAGNYIVALTVTDSEELSDTSSNIVKVVKSPIAFFTHTPEHPFEDEYVTFDASESYDLNGYIVSYHWDFGDGGAATVTTPTVTYLYGTKGTYTVTLTITDNSGYTDTTTLTVKIRLPGYPVADFTYSPDFPTKGETVTFNASESYDPTPGGDIGSYEWLFGDGETALVFFNPLVNHTYASTGEYTVTLEVADNDGNSDTVSKKVTVSIHPHAEFSWSPQIPQVYETVTFNASTSIPRRGAITSYEWNFGDGNITEVTSPIITHSYESCRDYTVTLKVTDSEGLSEVATDTITVGTLPIATFTYSPDFPIDGETVTFDASDSYDPDGSVNSYRWNFGDLNVTITTNPIITHTYMTIGNYTVILTAMDNDGLAGTATCTVRIRDYPAATFTYLPDRPVAGESVTFNASSSSSNGGVIISYEWDFGDGNTTAVTTPTITHVYITEGTYNVTLTITDSEGLSDAESKILSIGAYPVAAFTFSPTAPYVGDAVTFNASSSTPDGGVITSYEWDFGDGNTTTVTTPITTHIYTTPGNYTVSLTVADSEGSTDTTTDVITVNKAPEAYFTYVPDFPIAGEIITFNATESLDPNGYLVNYTWDFGDGNTTTLTNPIVTYAYTMEGNYTVALTVTDNNGFTDTVTETLRVRNYPTAAFTYLPDQPFVDETIMFNASSSSSNGGVIVSYEWDFGDGNTTTVTDPAIYHVYILVGNYTVTLNVTDSEGLWSTISKTINILSIGPTADFTWHPPTPKPNQTVTFNASSSILGWNGTHHPSIVSYIWDFGDGNITIVPNPIINHTYKASGNYNVTLTITDSTGLEDKLTRRVDVSIAREDVNGDGKINILDVYLVILAYGTREGDPKWDPRCDINLDGTVNIVDIYLVILKYGTTE